MSRAQTLYDKIWESHKIAANDGVALLYIDRHLVHEVTSPQAFEGLSLAGRGLWRAGSILAVPDHNVPTKIAPSSPIQSRACKSKRSTRTAKNSACARFR